MRKGNPEEYEYLILRSHIETVPRSFISMAQVNSNGPIKLSRLSDPITSWLRLTVVGSRTSWPLVVASLIVGRGLTGFFSTCRYEYEVHLKHRRDMMA